MFACIKSCSLTPTHDLWISPRLTLNLLAWQDLLLLIKMPSKIIIALVYRFWLNLVLEWMLDPRKCHNWKYALLLNFSFLFLTPTQVDLIFLRYIYFINIHKYLLADPGEARGCSTNSFVINWLIHSLSDPLVPTALQRCHAQTVEIDLPVIK